MGKRIICVIPARFFSTRLVGKPLIEICGHPLIWWVYKRASASKFFEKVFVATDDQRIKSTVETFGGKAIMTSPHHTSGTDRVGEVAQRYPCDIVVNIQGDEPLIKPEMMEEAIAPLLIDHHIFASTLKKRIDTYEDLVNPNVTKVVTDKDDFAIYFSRSPIPYRASGNEIQSDQSISFYKHIGIYVYQKEFLLKYVNMSPTPLETVEKLEQLRILENGYKMKVVPTLHDSVGVDTQEDVETVRELIESGAESL
ncbi:MAG: 3-deoxy-manno-octulosonate cytidylyltransferase [Thermodesulfobacteriota bacterium]|nr:3-deoxy-manno-octulosonate cytidylyltransferase [Thermodesulfobacteriota bacterium]